MAEEHLGSCVAGSPTLFELLHTGKICLQHFFKASLIIKMKKEKERGQLESVVGITGICYMKALHSGGGGNAN